MATVALLAGVIVAFAQPWKKLHSEPMPVAGENHAAPRSVTVAQPARASTSSVVLPATIRPWQTTTLYARASGFLSAWHKDLGATVKAGELLGEIETPELDQEVTQAEALAREAQAAAAQAKAEREEAIADLHVAETQLERARIDSELTSLQFARRAELVAQRAVAQEEYEIYQKQVETRRSEVKAAESDVARRRANLDTRAAIIDAREATAHSRVANVERLKELQSFKRIVAPFDGVVTQRSAQVGMLVTAGKEALFVVQDMSRVRVQANVPQAYAVQVNPGAAVTVSVPESWAKPLEGKITRTAASVDSTSRTMLAEIDLENGTGLLQPGSYAQIALSVSQDHSWTIPTNTLRMQVEGPHVAVVNDRQQVEIRPVTLGRDLGNRVVVNGLRGDERLIVNPGDDLVDGQSVEVASSPAPAKIAQRGT